jgi:Zn-dependent peptidase ImmA (M78 family)
MAAEKKEVQKTQNVRVSPKTFSAKKREAIMKRWYALREKGENAQDAAIKVGVSYLSLHKWEKRFGKPKSDKPADVVSLKEHKEKKAKMAEPMPDDSIVITTPKGYRIEIKDVETAKELLGD